MIISIGSVFCEPGVRFNVSHKVRGFIRKKLESDILKAFDLDKLEGERILSIDISTKKACIAVELRGPFLDKKNNLVNWYIDLPYKKTVDAENILVPYIQYFFEGLVLLFAKFNIKEEFIRRVQKEVEKEVINNPEYIYVPPEI